jgi:hypothetical protein
MLCMATSSVGHLANQLNAFSTPSQALSFMEPVQQQGHQPKARQLKNSL